MSLADTEYRTSMGQQQWIVLGLFALGGFILFNDMGALSDVKANLHSNLQQISQEMVNAIPAATQMYQSVTVEKEPLLESSTKQSQSAVHQNLQTESQGGTLSESVSRNTRPGESFLMDAKEATHSDYIQPRDFPSSSDFVKKYIIWADNPIPDNSTADLLVSRQNSEVYPKLSERMQVEFRACSSASSCPQVSDNPSGANKEEEAKKNRKWGWHTFRDTDTRRRAFPTKLKAVTYWSDKYQQHIALNVTLEESIKPCSGISCPRFCSDDELHPKFPYMYDSQDGLCKSSAPYAVRPRRNFGGGCLCESTCFTPEAVQENTTWPWKSTAHKERFLPALSEADKRKRRACVLEGKKWRQSDGIEYKARFACSANETSFHDCRLNRAFEHHVMYIPDAKLIFCGIPKAGITEWIKFLRYYIGAKDYLSFPHFKVDRNDFVMSNLGQDKIVELLTDPTWTKAVFLRDPAERLLSGYLDKIVGHSYTQSTFGVGSKDDKPLRKLTFEEFVDRVTHQTNVCKDPDGLDACSDPHWKPQLMTCGLDMLLPHYDFIGSFNHLGDQTKMLLEKVGLWDEFGSTFDDGTGAKDTSKHMCIVPPPTRPANHTVLGFNQRGISGVGNKHSTGSQSKMAKYYTPELLNKVREAYSLDFAVWDEVKDLPVEKTMTGRNLQIVKDQCPHSA